MVLLQTLFIKNNMPIQKNNSCRMGSPEKGQWVTIILLRASNDTCEDHNHLQSKILPRSHLLQTLGMPLSLSSYHHHFYQTPRKGILIFLTKVTVQTSLLLQSNAIAGFIAFHHIGVTEIPHQTKVQLISFQIKQKNMIE